MDSKVIGAKHGAAVRRAASFAAGIAAAAGRDAALNVRRVRGYVAGFARGLLRPGNA